MKENMERLIRSISVKNLFGLYSYSLPEKSNFSNAAILYGDNGVGKSTILKLAFHLLSAAGDKGHRNFLFKSKFKSLSVNLSSGHTLVAEFKHEDKVNVLSLQIKHDDRNIVCWDYAPSRSMDRHIIEASDLEDMRRIEHMYAHMAMQQEYGVPKYRTKRKRKPGDFEFYGEHRYMEELRKIVPTMYILSADRRLDSDEVSDPSDEIELRRVMRFEEASKINDLVVRSRDIALTQALSAAAKWVGRKAVQSANRGTENVHTVYSNVLNHIIAPESALDTPEENSDIESLIDKLNEIELKTNQLAEYEFATALSMSDFKKSLNTNSKQKRQLAAELLRPYIDSLLSRLHAIEPIFMLVDKFIFTVNELLSDKNIFFTLSKGFYFRNSMKDSLEPSQLSSGEQQLLLLFCYVLVARDSPSVFMIDEPEISLNIKWQRKLIQSLLDITDGSDIQFIFASHSMDILALHRSNVVKLENRQ